MVRAFASRLNSPGSSSGWGHCVEFLGKTLSTFTVALSTQVYYKWVLANLMLGVTLRWTSIQGGIDMLLFTSCYRNQDKLPPDGLLRSYVDF